mgnify:CR=1 FL=1
MQIAEARIARPKVVEGNPDTEFFEVPPRILRARDVPQEGRLGDLDLEPVRGQPGLRQGLANGARNIRAIKLPRRNIDRDIDIRRPPATRATRLSRTSSPT